MLNFDLVVLMMLSGCSGFMWLSVESLARKLNVVITVGVP